MTGVPREVFLSTAATRPGDRRLAAAFVIASIVGLALAAPFASNSWPVTPSFIAAYEAALLVSDLITAVLLIGQFRQVRSVGVLIVGCGYLFDAVIVAAHALSFPDVFSVTGLLGVSRQTTRGLRHVAVFSAIYLRLCACRSIKLGAPWRSTGFGQPSWSGNRRRWGRRRLHAADDSGHRLLPEIIRGNDYRRLLTSGISRRLVHQLGRFALLWVRTGGRTSRPMAHGRDGRMALRHLRARVISTERKRYESTLQEKNIQLQAAVEELDAFSYSVSHDLRAPLRAIDGFSKILLKQYGSNLPAGAQEYLQLVRDNTAQMGHLVDDLLGIRAAQPQAVEQAAGGDKGTSSNRS